MSYLIKGLDPTQFSNLAGLSDAELRARDVVRMTVTDRPGFPCRITLDDAKPGETVLLLNHVSLATGPYAARHAIFVTEGASEAAVYRDEMPPALERRILSLRAFDIDGMMVAAELAGQGEGDAAVRRLFANSDVSVIHAHNAVRGCFAAEIGRSDD